MSANPRVTRRFPIRIANPTSKIFSILRQAAKCWTAHLVFSKPDIEYYGLGVPPAPVPNGYPYFSSGRWVGLNAAQVRAGPMAQSSQLREAKRREEQSNNDNSKLNLELRIIEEGLRCQEQGLPMYDSDGKGG
jgi:hypothetical protein